MVRDDVYRNVRTVSLPRGQIRQSNPMDVLRPLLIFMALVQRGRNVRYLVQLFDAVVDDRKIGRLSRTPCHDNIGGSVPCKQISDVICAGSK